MIISNEILLARIKQLEDKYLQLTTEAQVVLGAINESKMYLEFVNRPEQGAMDLNSLVQRMERAVAGNEQCPAVEPDAVVE